jgi:hypothetical protein
MKAIFFQYCLLRLDCEYPKLKPLFQHNFLFYKPNTSINAIELNGKKSGNELKVKDNFIVVEK